MEVVDFLTTASVCCLPSSIRLLETNRDLRLLHLLITRDRKRTKKKTRGKTEVDVMTCKEIKFICFNWTNKKQNEKILAFNSYSLRVTIENLRSIHSSCANLINNNNFNTRIESRKEQQNTKKHDSSIDQLLTHSNQSKREFLSRLIH